ncbi:HD domain-containing protein [Grimontia hollisae]|uniref:Predicted hydrolase n=2 Tax=Grimontia hollisae TaxID=673 RepID=D0I6Q0_GRIHO|nr:HD domain-containing protein [Grimontia hollisae]AMG31493.1 HD domain-containing protein [Grimontia hollisae]EEY72319.1 predicted hydrolase [Grimontia hollisae CIP 101886]MDF2185865.1 HD domain-containing protein [Grimontia hollisae]STO45501.1 5'-nucleotidase [Grimontia hollisae]STO57906.1 5'-nucleotidase [Grimontia hollisae]
MSDIRSFERLEKQLALIVEIDQLKAVLRRTRVKSDGARLENSAEHSWQVALMALLLEEHANEPVDVAKVVKMLLIHDVVEIDAGDTFVYDLEAAKQQHQKELKAAERIFGMLPDDQRETLMALWLEFEEGETPEARYGKALDRMLPMLLNYHSEGQSWKEHGVRYEQALTVNSKIEKGSALLWQKVQAMLSEAAEKGWLQK